MEFGFNAAVNEQYNAYAIPYATTYEYFIVGHINAEKLTGSSV